MKPSLDASAAPQASGPKGGHHAQAFGLELVADFPLPGLTEHSKGRTNGAVTFLQSIPLAELEAAWDVSDPTTLLERRLADGALGLGVYHDPLAGYRIDIPSYGHYLVESSGSRVNCALPDRGGWTWQRALYNQVLPLAAVVSGFEVFHASAVVRDERALGFVGASGAGKSSTAVHMAALGAAMLTDDVLALSADGDGILAHAGVGVANVPDNEWAQFSPESQRRLGDVFDRSDKSHLAFPVADGPCRLGALYFLKAGVGDQLEVGPVWPPDPRLLLGSTFMGHVQAPERLVRQLDVCAQVAADVPMFEIRVPRGVPAAEVAGAVMAHRPKAIASDGG